ncbi:hypothetical protein [Candidatus Kuenenia stuttgartiensis]|uniref:hypothetical protein n=1 Tax=Kuenenia stuttgartiensis TaxID=174633 RepID=UPI00146B4C32|nr:hypothetical protein [Candidatus Kuenenia stuttgartiensis]
MFTSHFSMTTQPFSERINTSLIMKDERFTQGLHDSNTSYTQALSPSLTDRRGVGKSTLLKLFLSQIPQNLFLPIYLHFTHLKSSSLLSLIVSQLGEIPKHTKDRLFSKLWINPCAQSHSHYRYRRGSSPETDAITAPQTPCQLSA